MSDEIKNILEKPNVYSFADECYLYFGDYNKLKDYISNLQEENKKLKSQLDFIGEQNKYIDKLEKKLDMEKKINENNTNAYLKILHSEEAYKSRIEKAVEYMNGVFQRNEDGTDNIWILDFYEILNILNGDEDE